MRYDLGQLNPSSAIDPAFDRLDWRLSNGEVDAVEAACREIEGSVEGELPLCSCASLLLGEISLQRADPRSALELFQSAKDLPHPLEDRRSAGRARALTLNGQTAEALNELTQLLEGNPNSWRGWEALAYCQRSTGNEEAAWEALLNALALKPGSASALGLLLELGAKPGRLAALASALVSYLSEQPLAVAHRVHLVSCLLQLGDAEKALEQARRIVAFAPFSVIDEDVAPSMANLIAVLGG